MGKKPKEKLNKREKILVGFFLFLVLLCILVIGGYWYVSTLNVKDIAALDSSAEYKMHFMLIGDDKSDFKEDFYEGAKAWGIQNGVLVEDLNATLEQQYTVAELMKVAIAAKVDGIILEADASLELLELIDLASESGIPTVTVWEDSPQSKRQCFVGISGYQLGEIYGNQLNKMATSETMKVAVLVDYKEEADVNLVFLGMKDQVSPNMDIQAVVINREDEFSSEETIRSLAVNEADRPDILVCLDAMDTISAYQVAVDYNIVGKMQILGYFSSLETLEAIDKNIIAASVTVDSKEIGEKAVETLYQYRMDKHISEYETVEVQVITKENVDLFLDRRTADE